MSTAISTSVKTVDFPALSANSRQMRIIEANLEGEPMRRQDLIKVRTPLGGATKWSIDNGGNQETCDEIVGLCVCIAKEGVLWPSANPTEQRPIIVTNDLMVGYRVSDDLGSEIDPKTLEQFRIGDRKYDWAALASPTGPFGFSASGGGKRVKESRLLAILREGEVWPMIVTIGPGSLATWTPFQKRMPSFHYECVLGLKLEKAKGANGQPYSMVVPRVVGVISEEQGEIARRFYTDPLKKMFNAPPAGAVVAHTDDDE